MKERIEAMLALNYDHERYDHDPTYDNPNYVECQSGDQSACNALNEDVTNADRETATKLVIIIVIIIIVLVVYLIGYIQDIISQHKKQNNKQHHIKN